MNIYVINAYKERSNKYDERYTMYPAKWWTDITDIEVEKLHFRYNCKIPLRKKITACCLSHLGMIQKIIDEDLKDVVILEDDTIIKDFELLKEEVKLIPNEFCYLGGQINSPLVKDYHTFTKEHKKAIIDHIRNDNNIIQTIDTNIFRITHACGYYIPDKKVAIKLLSSIEEVYKGRKLRAIDVMFYELQKKGIIKYFIFPAIGTLDLKDAKQGFTYSHYKLEDEQSEY